MLFYAGVVALTTLLAWIYSHAKGIRMKRILYVLLVMFPATVSGLRGVGTDINHYFNYASEIIAGTYDLVDYKSIFTQITRFLLKHNVNFQVVLFVVSVITLHTMFKVFKIYSKDINFTFAVLSYMLVFYQMSFNTYRQIMAASLFMLATVYLYKYSDRKRCLVWFVVGILIHNSILPFGLLFLLGDRITEKKYMKQRIIVYVLLTIAIFSIPRLMSKMDFLLSIIPHYGWYITRFYRTGIGFGILRYLVMGAVPVVFLRLKKADSDMKMRKVDYLPVYIFGGFILWLTSYISESTIYRISYNTLIALPVLHGYIFKEYLKRSRMIIMLAVVAVMVFFWWYDGVILNTGETLPYMFFWEVR